MVDRAPTLKLACDCAPAAPFPIARNTQQGYSPRNGQLVTQFKYSSQEPWITGSDESDDNELAFPVTSGRPTFFLALSCATAYFKYSHTCSHPVFLPVPPRPIALGRRILDGFLLVTRCGAYTLLGWMTFCLTRFRSASPHYTRYSSPNPSVSRIPVRLNRRTLPSAAQIRRSFMNQWLHRVSMGTRRVVRSV
jgi:hypothetical protein